jgi:hypothetical protein
VTAVAGQPVPEPPQGVFGAVDSSAGSWSDGHRPGNGRRAVGTIVEVKAKPRVGSLPIAQTLTLTNCDGTGRCLASVTLDLPRASTPLKRERRSRQDSEAEE